jgi:glycosyltransferase involved in cell wall biosynthesis
MDKMRLSILTPTYNRSYILPKLFESLCTQSNHNFEWVIIDDGSTDDTEELVSNWISKELKFDIKYHKKKNGGKHTAMNVFGNRKLQLLAIKNTIASTNLDHFINEFVMR